MAEGYNNSSNNASGFRFAVESADKYPRVEEDNSITYSISGTCFTIPPRYEPIKTIGHGAYGIVCSARDKQMLKNIAIKKIPNAFRDLIDTKRTLREIKLLQHLKHENIISITDIFKPLSKTKFNDIYMCSELMDTDLGKVIGSSQDLSDDHCMYFLYQILRGLKYLHSANVLHRDLKPSNLLINGDCLLKIADFGLARIGEDGLGHMTEYVATRWYRAPEIILSWTEYSKAIDIWSIGCIFAELYTRRPLFQGKDYIHQIKRITDFIGTPSEEDICGLANEQARRFIRSLGHKQPVDFTRIIPKAPPLAIDLIQKMLSFNPSKRITVEEALCHPYLRGLHDPNDEPLADQVFDFDFEKWKLTTEMCRELIWREMLKFHPEAEDEERIKQEKEAQSLSTVEIGHPNHNPPPANLFDRMDYQWTA